MAASKKFGSATEFEAWIDKAQELTETEDTFKALKAITPALEAEWNNKACDIEVSNGKLKLLCKDGAVLAEQPILCSCDGTTTEKTANGSVTVKGLKDVNTLETYNLWIGTYDAYTKIASRSTNTIYGIKQDGGVAVCKAIHAEKDKAGRDIPTTYATQTGTYDSMTVGNATKAADVTTTINGKNITDIFESDGTTVKKATSAGACTGNAATATRATDADNADKATTAGGADKLNEEITITIKDNSGTYSGADVSFDGSKDITLKLPAIAKMDITGNAATSSSTSSVNGLEIKQDNNGVLKIGDIIIPQKKLLWENEEGKEITTNTAIDVVIDGKKIVCEYSVSSGSYNVMKCTECLKLVGSTTHRQFIGSLRTKSEGNVPYQTTSAIGCGILNFKCESVLASEDRIGKLSITLENWTLPSWEKGNVTDLNTTVKLYKVYEIIG